jgi:hypothetical protein
MLSRDLISLLFIWSSRLEFADLRIFVPSSGAVQLQWV